MHDHLRHMHERRYSCACISDLRSLGHDLLHVECEWLRTCEKDPCKHKKMEGCNFHGLSASYCACMSLRVCEVLLRPVHAKSSPSHFVIESVIALSVSLSAHAWPNRAGVERSVHVDRKPRQNYILKQRNPSKRHEWSSGPVVQTYFHVADFEVFVHIISRNAVRGMSGPVVQWSRPTFMLLISALSLCIQSHNYRSSETQ